MNEGSLEILMCNWSETSVKKVALLPFPMAVKDLIDLDRLCSKYLDKEMEGRYSSIHRK